MKYAVLFTFLLFSVISGYSQRLLTDVVDTIVLKGRQVKIIDDEVSNLSFSGYMQPQFQVAQQKGVDADYQGGAFAENSDNRFRLRRGRLRADYVHFHKDGSPATFFVFQFDGTEQGVNIRDFWGRYYENKLHLFSLTAGVMARPFGFELQLSSSQREAAERGRMSQILMKTERDLGVELSINPRKTKNFLKHVQLDFAVYNGQGLSGPREFDNKKDIVTRLSAKPVEIAPLNNLAIGGGVSALLGGIVSEAPEYYAMQQTGNTWGMQLQSGDNTQKFAPRKYYGADIAIETASKNWKTEMRAEYIFGLQTGTKDHSSTPGSYPVNNNIKQPLYTRPFDGAYFNLVQNIAGKKNQLVLKYDWYDPNTKVSGREIDKTYGLSKADIRYNTIGMGFLRHINNHLKILFWYDHIRNEATSIAGFEQDVKDNIFTLRTQFMF